MLARLAAATVLVPLLYLAAAGAASLWLVAGRGGDREGVEIVLVSNGYHASLLLPAQAAGVDWTRLFPPRPGAGTRYVLFGWGDRDFYMNTRTIADITPATAWRAVAGGSRGSVLHATWLDDADWPVEDVRLRLSPDRYVALAEFIRRAAGQPELIPAMGYGPFDDFYVATGDYSALFTCNEWIAAALREAGLSVPVWTPLPRPLLWRMQRASPDIAPAGRSSS